MGKRFVRFRTGPESQFRYGILGDDEITELSGPPWESPNELETLKVTDEVKLGSPVVPSKIVCVGLNYHAHVKASYSADEAPERPLLFLKPPSSIIGDQEKIHHPEVSKRVDYEAELGLVIGRTAKNVSESEAMEYLFGYTCVNDVTARDLQKGDGQWSRAKGFDTFCPVGPWIATDVDYRDLKVEGILNGEVMQSGRTSQMIFPIPFLISYISSVMTLNPGDLIPSGTPSGIAPMKSGDKIEVRIEDVGTLTNFME